MNWDMKWIIQDEVFGEETFTLIDALKKNNVHFTPLPGHCYKDYLKYFTDCTLICRGSVDFVIDGGNFSGNQTLTLDRYKCSEYYVHYDDHMVNHDFLICQWNTFCNTVDYLFDVFGTPRLFIRPNSGRKLFTGTTLAKKWANREIETILDLPNTIVEPEDLIVISSAKYINAEYRVLMCNDYAIDCSQYEGEGHVCKQEVMSYAESAAKEIGYFPDMYYVMDIALYNDEHLGILELNNLFSAGWYNVDYDKVVKHIKETYGE